MEPSTVALTLRRARELAGLDPAEGARRLGLRTRLLKAYEAGEPPVPAAVLSDAVAAYGSPEVVIPPRVSLHPSGDPRTIVVGTERIERSPTLDNGALLRRYVAAVRRQRGLGPTDPVDLRVADVAVLAGLVDLTDADLERELLRASGSSAAAVQRVARSLVLSGLVLLAAGASVVGGCSPSPGSDGGEPQAGEPQAEEPPADEPPAREWQATRDAERVARREQMAVRRAVLQERQESQARHHAEAAKARAEEHSELRAQHRSDALRRADEGSTPPMAPSAEPPRAR
jgi:transcriptional regulator with XRE-family HTH domain